MLRSVVVWTASSNTSDLGGPRTTRRATSLQEAGLPDVQGAALLGHDVATYRRFYLRTDEDAAAEAAAVAGRLFAV